MNHQLDHLELPWLPKFPDHPQETESKVSQRQDDQVIKEDAGERRMAKIIGTAEAPVLHRAIELAVARPPGLTNDFNC
jgi:hypothetical protein